jgi:gliding motility-associated-like protein
LAGNYTYQWSTVPQQSTALAAGIGAGTYSVTVSSAQSCPDTAVYVLTEPAAMTHQVTTTDPLCGFPNGIASVSESGGSQPYSYSWTPPIAMGSYSSILPAGNYTVNVYDNNNCSDTATFILNDQNPLKIFLGNDTLICPGQQVVLNPGAFASYRWQDNSPSATYTVKQTGQYEVTVTDNRGCTASDTINVTVDCSDLYFPTAFTPNDDGLNDLFGPFGNVTAVSQYSLRVYDRWGELVFYATSPFDKWDGRVKGKAPGSNLFVWSAQYILPGRGKLLRKGNTLLLR